ncbi:hypothetical protein CEUSTIGMA_g3473.t1 [Chlamydomonas eustigma]|uniref:Uncharacterized protein n=1 Tax=Chlamydomonas eustigma TaxID=1157962 RepID=A0A250WZU6_9CHLO|nr:hypothetical protein CEUSTIGMA_g3473.t1 [Chlamydomonas eustigma]|eukprot:GAX76030.1 hypothetical protein CEUSTIGMA_g3473.t1 [Chlamydomonas eustigma]
MTSDFQRNGSTTSASSVYTVNEFSDIINNEIECAVTSTTTSAGYHNGTAFPREGWIQPCVVCSSWTGGTVELSDKHELSCCKRCESKFWKLKYQLPIVRLSSVLSISQKPPSCLLESTASANLPMLSGSRSFTDAGSTSSQCLPVATEQPSRTSLSSPTPCLPLISGHQDKTPPSAQVRRSGRLYSGSSVRLAHNNSSVTPKSNMKQGRAKSSKGFSRSASKAVRNSNGLLQCKGDSPMVQSTEVWSKDQFLVGQECLKEGRKEASWYRKPEVRRAGSTRIARALWNHQYHNVKRRSEAEHDMADRIPALADKVHVLYAKHPASCLSIFDHVCVEHLESKGGGEHLLLQNRDSSMVSGLMTDQHEKGWSRCLSSLIDSAAGKTSIWE